ncbi:Sorbitol dehydrogenase [Geodia barretti]|uniref:Sorbitol dehydrogenase n=1 Tax=Geodia barretti TaxID=519541 RepID=A0AA35SWY2_GEOBA|nr:Sorbitol dehydrogenase [Geodia barretti]
MRALVLNGDKFAVEERPMPEPDVGERPISIALRGVSRSGFGVGQRTVVIGAGPIGLLTTMLLRHGGASDITVIEPSEMRRTKAEEVGADLTINPFDDDPTAIFGADIDMPDNVFECSGAYTAVDTAVDIVRPHGRCSWQVRDGVVIGHEFAGEVVSVGPGVEGWRAGDRAAVHPKGNVCGVCPECRDGLSNLCSAPDIGGTAGIGSNGGMAAYVSIPAGKLRSLPDEVSLLEGAWVEPIAVALRGVSRSGFKVGRRAVVVGAGPIGLLTVMHLRLGGASQITVLEPSEMRRAKAEELGADITINPITDDPTEIFGNDIERPDYAFECSAAPSALDTAVEILPHNGTPGAARRCDIPDHYVEEFDIAIRLLARKALDVQPLTSDVVGLEGVLDAMERLEQGKAIKILVQPND